MPATPQVARWFVDENSLGVAKALAYVRGDITWPGAIDGPVPAGAADTAWLPVIGTAGLVVLTLFEQLRLSLRYWDDIENLVAHQPAPWLASVTRAGVRVFDTRKPPEQLHGSPPAEMP